MDSEQLRLDAARQEHDRISQQQANEGHAAFMKEVADHEQALVDVVPEWGRDPEKAKSDLNDIRAYAVSQGAPKELVDREYRSYTLLMARKAMLYDQQQAKAPEVTKKLRKLPKVLKAGAKKERVDPEVAQHRVNLSRFSKSHSVKDAAAVFKSMKIV